MKPLLWALGAVLGVVGLVSVANASEMAPATSELERKRRENQRELERKRKEHEAKSKATPSLPEHKVSLQPSAADKHEPHPGVTHQPAWTVRLGALQHGWDELTAKLPKLSELPANVVRKGSAAFAAWKAKHSYNSKGQSFATWHDPSETEWSHQERELAAAKVIVSTEAPEVQHAAPAALTQSHMDKQTVTRSPTQAAEALYAYASKLIHSGKSDELGSTAHPNRTVAQLQHEMRMKLPAEQFGIYGLKTMARGKELLGKPFPQRVPHVATTHAAAAPAATHAAAAPAPASPDAAHEAAAGLDHIMRARGSIQGQRAEVARLQFGMGLDADGLPGPLTRERVQKLLGPMTEWVHEASELAGDPVPGGDSPHDAAQRLVRYVKQYGGSRHERIAAYQRVLGVEPAGIVGPKTKEKVNAQLGEGTL